MTRIAIIALALMCATGCMFSSEAQKQDVKPVPAPIITISQTQAPILIKGGIILTPAQYLDLVNGKTLLQDTKNLDGYYYLSPDVVDVKDGKVSLKKVAPAK